MKKIFTIGILLFSFLNTTTVFAEDLAKYGYEISTSYKTLDKKTNKIVGQRNIGTAVGVDLSNFSYHKEKLIGNSYLITAAHVVTEKDAIGPLEMFAKIPELGFIKIEVIVLDTSLDIAIIKCKMDLPFITHIDFTPIEMGLEIINVGCPEGVDPIANKGKITDTFKESFIADVKGFYHGSSGGGMFRADNEKLIGISTSGLADKNDPLGMKRGMGIFVPIKFIKIIID